MSDWQDEVRSRWGLPLRPGQGINDSLNEDGWTVLHNAVEAESATLVEKLVESGADLNVRTTDGWSPLHLAVDVAIDGAIQNNTSPDFSFCKKLVALGARLDAQNERGDTPRDIAVGYGANALRLFDDALNGWK